MAKKFEEKVEWVDEDGNINSFNVEAKASVSTYLHNLSLECGNDFRSKILETVADILFDEYVKKRREIEEMKKRNEEKTKQMLF